MDKSGKTKFLIDGFPRKLDQAFKFDETVGGPRFTLADSDITGVLSCCILSSTKTEHTSFTFNRSVLALLSSS